MKADGGRNAGWDSDDLLGTVEIRSTGSGSGSFTEDGAKYIVHWR